MKVLLALGYYEGGGFTTVVNMLSKYLQEHNVNVTIAARVIRIKPPGYVKLINLDPDDLPAIAEDYDVIHIHQSYPYLNTAVKARLTNVVFASHGFPPIYSPWLNE